MRFETSTPPDGVDWAAVAAWWDAWGAPIGILIVIVGAFIAFRVVRTIIGRVVGGVVSGVKRRADAADTEALSNSPLAQVRVVQRTRAIGSVLNTMLAWVIAALALILILSILGVNAASLVAMASFLGAAAGIGAQGVIKDFLNGLFMVFEDQVGIGDLVDLGAASGVVESVGIRVTQVRDVEGTLWYVRNGEILRVGNRSQGWARVIIDQAVPYDADVDLVERQLLDVATAMSEEPEWLGRVIDKPETWGIESVSPDAVVLRLVVRTRANARDDVARELRRRVKDGLDELGLDLPSVQKVVGDGLEAKP
ncbi:mechanosensitive ion channel family protein [Agrococcus jenensis]|uniref:Small conductance mechanosensitive channel n=1 Tax=Agrococcus jenensis TaxID=46353 RepID=A0A3N2AUI4_9MICO|nr:mechanosensitive ion channel domain-containing protein [Agrococcus jenensis]ROR66693.1 small conductance mechanosensitive channel [Agrococcus jenensis]